VRSLSLSLIVNLKLVGLRVKKLSSVNRWALAFGAVMALSSISSLVYAKDELSAEKQTVQGTLTQAKISIAADGKELTQPAETVKPGDLIEYRVAYVNRGLTSVNNLIVTLPIPRGLDYVGLTDQPRAALASTDGAKFESIPLKRTVRRADGTEVLENVPLSEYRALRWSASTLAAGKTQTFTARATVQKTVVASAR
jgi:uncharacterized repeat protein (TIGR01451 family)